MTDNEALEKRGLWLSIIGALFMAALGIGFAIGLVSLRVATLVRRPDDEFYHLGYAAYEPMLNLCKGLLLAFITVFAWRRRDIFAELTHGGARRCTLTGEWPVRWR